jgi:protein KRI1
MPRKKNKTGDGGGSGGGAAPSQKAALFEEDRSGDTALRINASFAASFEERKRRQDLSRAAELGLLSAPAAGEGGASSASSSEDEGALLDPATEAGIRATIAAIRARDPRIYDPGARFFLGGGGGDSAGAAPAAEAPAAEAPAAKKKVAKGKSARELLRAQLLEAAAAGREDAFEDDDALDGARGVRRVDDGDRSANPRLYDEEQRELRAAFLRDSAGGGGGGGGGSGAGAEDEGEEGEGALFRVKPTTASQRAAEEEDARVTREVLLAAMRAKTGGVAAHAEELADPEGFLDSFMTSSAWRLAEREGEDDAAEEAAAAAAAAAASAAAARTTASTAGGTDSEEELERAESFEATCVARPFSPPPAAPSFAPI